jgi:urease accessory protein
MSRTPTRTRTHIRTPELAAPASATEPHGSLKLFRLLHLASPALPIGAFHFSQGLEYAVECGWVRDEATALDWIGGIAGASLATLDLPVLYRLHAAWLQSDHVAVQRWNSFLIACRETGELRAEDRHLGSAMLRVLAELELRTEPFAVHLSKGGVSYAAAFTFACASWRIDAPSAAQTYAWAWAENQVLAAVKLIPLGQSAGQRLLHALTAPLAAYSTRAAEILDADIGISTALSAVASGRHETQYSRLFRS